MSLNQRYRVAFTRSCIVMAMMAFTVVTWPAPDNTPATAAAASDAIRNYWQNVKAGKVDDAVGTYIDTIALVDLATATDAAVTREQRDSAARDLRGFLGIAWKQPQVASAIRTSELKVKSEQPAPDGTTAIQYVVTLREPTRQELPNTAYVRKGSEGWRIVDMKQADGPRLSETLRSGWTGAHQKLPSLTFDQFVNMMTSSLTRKASTGAGATTKPSR